MYEKKIADGYEVLEVPKGTWVEAIFAKLKPEVIKPRIKYDESDIENEDEDADVIVEDNYVSHDEVDEMDEFNEDEMTEDNYRTTFEIESDPDDEAVELSEYGSEE
jgi:ornithine carbamoyltransferase